MRKGDLLRAGHVLTADQYAGQAEADIEDIIGRSTFVELVNKCYGLSGARALPTKKPKDAPDRAVKEAELHVDNFDHFRPAEYLTQQGLSLELTDLDKALDRFERLFVDLNALLSA
jgi:hypothetical protein